jgi:hypothetical protein
MADMPNPAWYYVELWTPGAGRTSAERFEERATRYTWLIRALDRAVAVKWVMTQMPDQTDSLAVTIRPVGLEDEWLLTADLWGCTRVTLGMDGRPMDAVPRILCRVLSPTGGF